MPPGADAIGTWGELRGESLGGWELRAEHEPGFCLGEMMVI